MCKCMEHTLLFTHTCKLDARLVLKDQMTDLWVLNVHLGKVWLSRQTSLRSFPSNQSLPNVMQFILRGRNSILNLGQQGSIIIYMKHLKVKRVDTSQLCQSGLRKVKLTRSSQYSRNSLVLTSKGLLIENIAWLFDKKVHISFSYLIFCIDAKHRSNYFVVLFSSIKSRITSQDWDS